MSQSLRSMSDSDKLRAVSRRIGGNDRGLGYWAAVDAHKQNTKSDARPGGEDLGEYSSDRKVAEAGRAKK